MNIRLQRSEGYIGISEADILTGGVQVLFNLFACRKLHNPILQYGVEMGDCSG
jgi:hypothetical protein